MQIYADVGRLYSDCFSKSSSPVQTNFTQLVHNRYLCNSTEYRETAFFEARKSVTKKCKTFAFYIGRRYGLQVTLIYLIIKCLYIAVGITQLYWIDCFLRGAEAQNWTMKGYYYNLFTSSYVLHVLRLVQKYYHITGRYYKTGFNLKLFNNTKS